jgi:hypothetical protein
LVIYRVILGVVIATLVTAGVRRVLASAATAHANSAVVGLTAGHTSSAGN